MVWYVPASWRGMKSGDLKRAYNPANLFSQNQNIRPDGDR
jgi:hypothetical protein